MSKKTIVGRIKEVKIVFDKDFPPELVEDKENTTDPCPVCDKDLYYNDKYTKRIAMVEDGMVSGWMCPHCYTEFTTTDEVVRLMSKLEQGES